MSVTPATIEPTVLDRLLQTMLAFAHVVADIIRRDSAPSNPTRAQRAAPRLFGRLCGLCAALGRIALFGPRTQRPPPARPQRDRKATGAAGVAPLAPAEPMPRHPGWLLEVMPDVAPTVAADLAPLLAAPSVAAYLATDPTLSRKLRPLLRALGLAVPAPPEPGADPEPAAPRPGTPAPSPTAYRPADPAPPTAPPPRRENTTP